jgi:uncharacterized protein YndB with AHSA1/START domain
MNNEPFVIERVFLADAPTIWRAISDAKAMKEWYFDIPEFKPEPGLEFKFTGGPDDRPYVHLCKVTEVETGRKLTYSWRYEGYEGISYVSFELFPEGESTRLRLTHSGLETFPASNPDLAKENFAAGWTEIIGTSLGAYLENIPQKSTDNR